MHHLLHLWNLEWCVVFGYNYIVHPLWVCDYVLWWLSRCHDQILLICYGCVNRRQRRKMLGNVHDGYMELALCDSEWLSFGIWFWPKSLNLIWVEMWGIYFVCSNTMVSTKIILFEKQGMTHEKQLCTLFMNNAWTIFIVFLFNNPLFPKYTQWG